MFLTYMCCCISTLLKFTTRIDSKRDLVLPLYIYNAEIRQTNNPDSRERMELWKGILLIGISVLCSVMALCNHLFLMVPLNEWFDKLALVDPCLDGALIGKELTRTTIRSVIAAVPVMVGLASTAIITYIEIRQLTISLLWAHLLLIFTIVPSFWTSTWLSSDAYTAIEIADDHEEVCGVGKAPISAQPTLFLYHVAIVVLCAVQTALIIVATHPRPRNASSCFSVCGNARYAEANTSMTDSLTRTSIDDA